MQEGSQIYLIFLFNSPVPILISSYLLRIMICHHSENIADQLYKGLWIGGADSAHSVDFINENNITVIINITPDIDNIHTDIKYHQFPVHDDDTCALDLFPVFEKVAKMIHKYLLDGENILVHCKRGHHRSASVIGAYLLQYQNFTFTQLVNHINSVRPCAMKRMTCMVSALRKYYQDRILKINYEFDD